MNLYFAVVVNQAQLPKFVHERTDATPCRTNQRGECRLINAYGYGLRTDIGAKIGQQQECPRQLQPKPPMRYCLRLGRRRVRQIARLLSHFEQRLISVRGITVPDPGAEEAVAYTARGRVARIAVLLPASSRSPSDYDAALPARFQPRARSP